MPDILLENVVIDIEQLASLHSLGINWTNTMLLHEHMIDISKWAE